MVYRKAGPMDLVVEHQMEARSLLQRAMAELIAANRILDPIALTKQTPQIERSA